MSVYLLGIIKGLHDVASALWIGGIFTLGFVFLPPAKRILGKNEKTGEFFQAVQKRITLVAYLSIIVLFITGIIIKKAAGFDGGIFDFSTPYSIVLSIKHIIVFLMIFLALFRGTIMNTGVFSSPKLGLLKNSIMYVNISLGFIVLILSGINAVLR